MFEFYRSALEARGVTPCSTWMFHDGSEVLIILDENFLVEGSCDQTWVRVVRLPMTNKKAAKVDVMFVPAMCGMIDSARLSKIV